MEALKACVIVDYLVIPAHFFFNMSHHQRVELLSEGQLRPQNVMVAVGASYRAIQTEASCLYSQIIHNNKKKEKRRLASLLASTAYVCSRGSRDQAPLYFHLISQHHGPASLELVKQVKVLQFISQSERKSF